MIQTELKILLLLSLLSFFADVSSGATAYYKKCFKNPKFYSVLYAHHIITTFTYLGWMSSNVYVLIYYIVSNIMIYVHWNCYSNKCFITEYIQKECESDAPFRDLYYFLGLKNQMENICGFFMILTVIKLYKKYKNSV
jgi:hypothetical protein